MNTLPTPDRRVVAIVGRPNVGKSALFNRLTKRRLSIVHEESGVTRDRVMAEASWAGNRFDLVDTGGLGLMDGARAGDVFEEGIRSQVAIAIQDAAALIFVVTADTGLVPLDQEVARLLHESGRPVFLAVNKSDNLELDTTAEQFVELGFPVFPVSALHNRGLDPLLEALLPTLPRVAESSRADPLKVAIVGKPNAGKSSYINRLLRSDRVMVSDIPGTTRDSVEIPFSVGSGPDARHYLLIDTAGLRQKKKVKEAVDKFSMIRTEKSIEMADVVVHVLDAETGYGANDKKISSLIAGQHKGCLLLVNKWDLSQVTQRAYQKRLLDEAPFLRHVAVEFSSALSGYNIRRSIDAIDKVAAQIRTKLSTGVLNRVLQDTFTKVPPPVVKNKRVRFFYATQTGTHGTGRASAGLAAKRSTKACAFARCACASS